MTVATKVRASRAGTSGDRRHRAPVALAVASGVVGLVVLAPVIFVAIQAQDTGWSASLKLLERPIVATLFGNTIRLTAAVTFLCAIIGTAAASLVERTTLPGRRVWSLLFILPLAIPEFVVSYGWVSVSSVVRGFGGALLVETLTRYPLVYLLVAATLRGMDPVLEESAQSLGCGKWRTYWRVTLGQARPAILGGSLLVALYLLSDYGAFAMLGFRTFTTEIFAEYKIGFNISAASALAFVLVAISLILLVGEQRASGRARYARVGQGAARPPQRQHLGWLTPVALLASAALVALALGVPFGSLGYWLVRGSSTTLPSASILGATGHTVEYSLMAAALATVMAMPVAVLAVRHRSPLATALERSTYVARAVPGVVIGLAFVFYAIRYLPWLYQSTELLVLGYAVVFLPLALVAVRAGLQQAPAHLEEIARSLGESRWSAFRRVTLPLIGPALAAAFALVFLSATTELTATLLLRPTGVETLATQFWVYTSALAYGAAAPYAALLVVASAVPTLFLTRRLQALSGTMMT
jgi:iron(III) transport system permease protein